VNGSAAGDARRRVVVLVALVELAVAGAWCAWRVHAALADWSGIGGPTDWITQQLLDVGAQLATPGGALAFGLVAAGAAAGALVLGRPARIERGLVLLTVMLLVTALGVQLGCMATADRWVVYPPWWGIVLLSAVLVAAAALVAGWSRAAWLELGQPAGAPAHEASRVLFAAGPVLIATHLVLGDELARLRPDALGLAASASGAGSITASGLAVLTVAIVRSIRRERAAATTEPRRADGEPAARP
jgi:hypothetical protein